MAVPMKMLEKVTVLQGIQGRTFEVLPSEVRNQTVREVTLKLKSLRVRVKSH